jgi:hypothetical protein
LTAGLIAAGFKYFSDDVIALEPDSLRLAPFSRSLCVKSGSRGTLLPLYPELVTARVRRLQFEREWVWFLPPPEEAWASETVDVRYVVLPKYVPGAETRLEPITRSAALEQFFTQSFNLNSHGAGGIAALVKMLGGAECFSLTTGSLDPAVRLLKQVVTS